MHGLYLKMSYDLSGFVGSSLISMYSKCGVIKEAYLVFDEVSNKNLGMWNAMLIAWLRRGSITSMVYLLGRAGKLHEAVKITKEMPMQPIESVWGALLTGCRIHGNTELAEEEDGGEHTWLLWTDSPIEGGEECGVYDGGKVECVVCDSSEDEGGDFSVGLA
ncbi:Hypothetical predicted protein [Olea europaea subsp. europaea]|uniref:Pentatricopeptide repeat-containing protein n=1 Tax=Olea europaea subsp. europaea TaxID=158383 RepID=A0A8S0SPB4_OLEEU|nr:Hypothetical predicted protein [Olea europaea subsp. europaea]